MPYLFTVCNRDLNFNKDWLKLIEHDPVHPIDEFKNLERRTMEDRLVYFMVVDGKPMAILETALCNNLPKTVTELWTNPVSPSRYFYAIFYSVFRLPDSENIKGMARELIFDAAADIRFKFGKHLQLLTFSPIPSLNKNLPNNDNEEEVWNYLATGVDPVAKFHYNNGAVLARVCRNADKSQLRIQESNGWMVNYRYN